MKTNRLFVRSAATLALLSAIPAVCTAQGTRYDLDTKLSFAQGERQTWNTVLIVSSVVLLAGLLSDNSAMTTLGGVGVLFALVQTDQLGYRQNYSAGLPILAHGNTSLRVNPLAHLVEPNRFSTPKPSLVLQSTFKF